uniref:Myelin protein zero like 1 n=1 Tax=Taeniopygia guttata TaxID=59729 RepID=A0A674GLE7_TAEGU
MNLHILQHLLLAEIDPIFLSASLDSIFSKSSKLCLFLPRHPDYQIFYANQVQCTTVQVSAVEVNTPEEMFVENGTDAKLPCTFTSVEVISSAASVSWSFQPEGAATRISFFYYSNGKSYPGKDIPFKDRITWAGDLNKKDASITISNMQFRDNGTYICDVKNPPDIVVKPGEIRVRVVEKGIHSPYMIFFFLLTCFLFSTSIPCLNHFYWGWGSGLEGTTVFLILFFQVLIIEPVSVNCLKTVCHAVFLYAH